MDYAVLRLKKLTAREISRHITLNSEQDELEKQERREREELARKNKELEKESEAARETNVRLKEAARGNQTSQDAKRRTAERENSRGSRGEPEIEW